MVDGPVPAGDSEAPLPEQLETIERLLERAKGEQDWQTIPALKATAELVRSMLENADALKVPPSLASRE